VGCHNLHTAPPTETQRRADNMTITEASAASIINRLPTETIDKYEQWLAEQNNIVLGND